ncbi:MAG TPA: DUF3866 family protein [Chthonomonadales bacterium]|nr:DUF3866 family protein [Chthonomonadales bacterium]
MRGRMRGTVVGVDLERNDLQEIRVCVGDEERAAICYPGLTGAVRVGDEVVLNTWAVEMRLGSGGADFVASASLGAEPSEPPGHIIKLRYTPLQLPVLAAEAPESPYHDAVSRFRSLDGIPVVCAELHSQLPAIVAAAKWETLGSARVVYVMTDGAALPLAYSRLVHGMREARLIDATVTAGQAFGGDFEAVNLYSALAVARVAARADIIVICQGPGTVGTGTALGFSGIEQGTAINAAAILGGTAIAVARLSFADPRPRHVGLSHHTRTVLGQIAQCSALVPIPSLPEAERRMLMADLERAGLRERHEFVTVQAVYGLEALERSGIRVTTMGRGVGEERPFFLAAAAAGQLAGQIAASG